MLKRLSNALLGVLVSAPLLLSLHPRPAHADPTGRAAPDPLRAAYSARCLPAARHQLRVGRRGSTDGTRVAARLCECAADRAESSGWVLPEFPARDAEECLSWARGFLAASPFAPGSDPAVDLSHREARSTRLPARRSARPSGPTR